MPDYSNLQSQIDRFNETRSDRSDRAKLDTSTVGVTIGLDVLDHLINLACSENRHSQADRIIITIAKNAARAAYVDAPNLKPVDRFAEQRPWDGPYVVDGKDGDPSDLDYETKDHCDRCNDLNHTNLKTKVLGTMFHARGATGRVCPVLFLCHACKEKH